MGRKKHLEHLIEYKKKISKKIGLKRMILFGSRAGRRVSRWSDFDLILVGRKFDSVNVLERSRGLWIDWDLDYPVDFLCYTPEEFNKLKKQATIVREAVENGIEIR